MLVLLFRQYFQYLCLGGILILGMVLLANTLAYYHNKRLPADHDEKREYVIRAIFLGPVGVLVLFLYDLFYSIYFFIILIVFTLYLILSPRKKGPGWLVRKLIEAGYVFMDANIKIMRAFQLLPPARVE